jgi:hypothetical protein
LSGIDTQVTVVFRLVDRGWSTYANGSSGAAERQPGVGAFCSMNPSPHAVKSRLEVMSQS